MPTRAGITPSDKRAVGIILAGLRPLSKLRVSFPLPYALVFLSVAAEEGKPMAAYGRELGLTRFNISRYVRCIGDQGRGDTPGLGLVTSTRSKTNPHLNVFLTAKGRVLAKQVFENLRKTSAEL
jgi:hypothetical protein